MKGAHSCESQKKTFEYYAVLALHYLTPLKIEINDVMTVGLPTAAFEKDFSKNVAVRVPESINMTCSKGPGDFPNSCSGKLTVDVLTLNPQMKQFEKFKDLEQFQMHDLEELDKRIFLALVEHHYFTYGMALYFYSSYQEKDQQVHEVIDVKYALDTDGICSVESQLSSGACFGMGGSVKSPENPPLPPALEEITPVFPQVQVKQPPRALGLGHVLLILLVLALLGGLTAAFFWRRQKLIQANRNEVELS